mgnify:CR=1 FL=1
MKATRAKKVKEAVASVKTRCVFCKGVREVKAGEMKPGDHPMCTLCGGPMVAVGARVG